MSVAELVATRRPAFSFDFLPPRDDAGVEAPLETLRELRPLGPAFVSVTDGAGGSTRARTVELVKRLQGQVGIPPAFHAALPDVREDAQAALDVGVTYATLQCAELLRRGAPGIHLYTLNRSPATRAILRALRLHEPWRIR